MCARRLIVAFIVIKQIFTMSDGHLSLSMHIKLHHLSKFCCMGTGHDVDVSVFIGDFNSIWWVHVVTLVPINDRNKKGCGIVICVSGMRCCHIAKCNTVVHA